MCRNIWRVSAAMLTRFAPSPTGALHLGHAYSALLAHDAARRAGGSLRIRIDDIDGSRSREAHVAAALAELAWLGIGWDGDPVRQSRHLGAYDAALRRSEEHTSEFHTPMRIT